MPKVSYHGHATSMYTGYIDQITGQTLVCEPGETYNILSVNAVHEVPLDGRFTVIEPPRQRDKKSGTKVTASETPSGGKD